MILVPSLDVWKNSAESDQFGLVPSLANFLYIKSMYQYIKNITIYKKYFSKGCDSLEKKWLQGDLRGGYWEGEAEAEEHNVKMGDSGHKNEGMVGGWVCPAKTRKKQSFAMKFWNRLPREALGSFQKFFGIWLDKA